MRFGPGTRGYSTAGEAWPRPYTIPIARRGEAMPRPPAPRLEPRSEFLPRRLHGLAPTFFDQVLPHPRELGHPQGLLGRPMTGATR